MTLLQYSIVVILFSLSFSASLQAAPLTVGSLTSPYGELTFSGFLRAKYQDKSWPTENEHKLAFDVAKLNVDYQKDQLYAHVEYRCYQFDKLCDFSSLVDAYIGYQWSVDHHLQVGMQSLPFGPARFWESNYYGGINTQYGLEDVHNLGIQYQIKATEHTQLDLAYFPRDAGSFHGDSQYAARYSANLIKTDASELSSLKEKNMWLARLQYDLPLQSTGLHTRVGTSYWYSNIDNLHNHQTGTRHAWNIFTDLRYQNLNLIMVFGQNHIRNQDPINDQSIAGSFDDVYWIANKGNFYSVDLRYQLPEWFKSTSISPYMMASGFMKDPSGYKNSTRNLIGVSIAYKKLTWLAEYIMGKNDVLIGGDQYSYAQGSVHQKTNKLLNLQVLYSF